MNYVKLTDLDELALTVRDKDSQLYITDAISTYRIGAYRSAIMSTWIAVVTDYISKIRELANQGDANASTIISDLDNAILSNNVLQLQKIENELLDKAYKDFEFLARQEYTDLNRLKDDRNMCAHPAFVAEGILFQPQPDLVRTHIVHAITHLLRHQPVQGKSALTRIQNDITRSSFPSDIENVKKLLSVKYLNRAKSSLIKNLIISLLKGYLKEETTLVGKDKAVINSLIAVSSIHQNIFEETLQEKLTRVIEGLDDEQLKKIFRLISVDSRYWALLDEPTQIRIKGIFSSLNYKDSVDNGIFDLKNINEFNELIITKFSKLEDSYKEKVISLTPHPVFADDAIALYSKSGGFRTAERLGHNVLLPVSIYFNKEQVLKVLKFAAENRNIKIAGESPDILADFFNLTSPLLNDTKDGWIEFIDALSDDPNDRFSYSKLREEMVKQGLLSTPYPETDISDV